MSPFTTSSSVETGNSTLIFQPLPLTFHVSPHLCDQADPLPGIAA